MYNIVINITVIFITNNFIHNCLYLYEVDMENTEVKVIRELQKIRKGYDSYLNLVATNENLTKIEVAILGFLSNNSEFNTARDIEDILDLKKSNISVAIDNLASRGFIEKNSDEVDRRITRLSLSSKSGQIVEKIKSQQESFCMQIFKGISSEEIELYLKTVKKIIENISQGIE